MPSRAFQDPAAIADRSTKVIYDKFSQEERRDAARRIITQRDGKDPHRKTIPGGIETDSAPATRIIPCNGTIQIRSDRWHDLWSRHAVPFKSKYHFTPQYEDPAIKVSPRVQQTEYKDYDSRVQAARAARPN